MTLALEVGLAISEYTRTSNVQNADTASRRRQSRISAARPSWPASRGPTVYPRRRTAEISGAGSETAPRTEAVPDARLTEAAVTPGCSIRVRSMRFTHDAHVMPSTSRMSTSSVTVGSLSNEGGLHASHGLAHVRVHLRRHLSGRHVRVPVHGLGLDTAQERRREG